MAKGIRISHRAPLARPCLLALLLLAPACGKNRTESTRCPEPALPTVAAPEAEPKGAAARGAESDDEVRKRLSRATMPAADQTRPSRGMVEMDVLGVGRDDFNMINVLLEEKTGQRRIMVIVVGQREGEVIDLRLRGETFERPLTHDLLDAVLRDRGVKVARIEVDGLRDGTFLGRLFLADEEGRVSRLDARPSDCIALAIGAGAPIFVAESVLDQTGRPPESIKFRE